MTNLQRTVRRLIIIVLSLVFLLIIRASIWRPYGKNLADPRYDQNDGQFAKYCQTLRNPRFQEVFCCWSSVRHFGALTVNLRKPHSGPKYGPFLKHSHRLFIHRFLLVYLCVSCKQHFGVPPVKFLLNQITTHKMTSLEKVVTRLRIIVLCYSYSAYDEKDTLELLPWNCNLTALWRKRWPICQILSLASKSFDFI